MKGMSDSLRDLSVSFMNHTLVLNLLCDLNPRYSHPKALIKRIVPFPTFHVVRNEILHEELTMETEAPALAPALYSALPVARHLWGARPSPSIDRGSNPTLLPPPLWPLVWLPMPTEVVVPAKAATRWQLCQGWFLRLGW